jgi:hypothetical protein
MARMSDQGQTYWGETGALVLDCGLWLSQRQTEIRSGYRNGGKREKFLLRCLWFWEPACIADADPGRKIVCEKPLVLGRFCLQMG